MRTKTSEAPKRRGQGCLLLLAGVALLAVGLALAGAVYESAAEAANARAGAIVRMVEQVRGAANQ